MGERYHFKDQGYAKHLQEPCKSYSTTSLTHIKVAHLQLSSREFDMVPQYCTQFIPLLKVM